MKRLTKSELVAEVRDALKLLEKVFAACLRRSAIRVWCECSSIEGFFGNVERRFRLRASVLLVLLV